MGRVVFSDPGAFGSRTPRFAQLSVHAGDALIVGSDRNAPRIAIMFDDGGYVHDSGRCSDMALTGCSNMQAFFVVFYSRCTYPVLSHRHHRWHEAVVCGAIVSRASGSDEDWILRGSGTHGPENGEVWQVGRKSKWHRIRNA